MTISVFGLGYVGVTTAACLANQGHDVTGVDIVERKVQAIESGESPIIEEGLDDLIWRARKNGRLRATTKAKEALQGAEITFVCVGTPSRSDGSLDTSSVRKVATEIGEILSEDSERQQPLLIVFRSTMLPGTTRDELIPLLEEYSGHAVGGGYEVAFHPEFMREGSAVEDFRNPPKIVVGEREEGVGNRVWELYDDSGAPQFSTSLEAAEAVKYADNAFHALKITFANEIGQILRAHGVDSRKVMSIFREDRKLNISPAYLRPGFAFGGSCLPKDLRALTRSAREKGVDHPMLDGILTSNKRHVERALDRVVERDPDRVGMVGLSYKPGTDDLRESPLVELAERLLGKGVSLKVFDRNVSPESLIGTNKSYVDHHLPHLSELIVDSINDLTPVDLIVIGHPVGEDRVEGWIGQDIQILDLVGVSDRATDSAYEGIAW